MKLVYTAILFFGLMSSLWGCATMNKEQRTASDSAAFGAVIGTAIFPGVGTLIGAGMGWMGGKRLVKTDKAKRVAELKDELEKQAALRAKIRSLQPWVVTNTAGRVLRNES